MKIRVASYVRSAHHGTKERFLNTKPLQCPSSVSWRLPQTYLANQPATLLAEDFGAKWYQSEDIEETYREHRWGWLSDALLACDYSNKQLQKMLVWIDANQDTGTVWWEPYSTSERVANSLLWMAVAASDITMIEPDRDKYIQFLIDSALWVSKRLEYYGAKQTNNHFLNNARMLIMVGMALSWQQATDLGIKIMDYMLPKLIASSGMFRERSSHYQLLFCHWLLDIRQFLSLDEAQYATQLAMLDQLLNQVVSATNMLLNTQGYLKCFVGDISPDISPEKLCQRIGQLYGKVLTLESQKNTSSMQLDDWFFLRQGHHEVIANAPEGIFPFVYPTHGHNDLTSFCWLVNGKPRLFDLGRSRYTRSDIVKNQVAARGHNVMLIDGLGPLSDSLINGGYWSPTPYAKAAIQSSFSKNQNEWVVEHTGFHRLLGKKAVHKRTVTILDNGIRVADEIMGGTGHHDVVFHWHFSHEGLIAYNEIKKAFEYEDHNITVSVDMVSPYQASVTTVQAARAYGYIEDATLLCIETQVDLPATVVTEFILS